MKNDSVSLMLFDVSRELIEMAKAAKARAAKSGDDYDKGQQMGLYQAVSLLQQQADAFQIERAELGLDSVDPEQDLL